MRRLSLFAILLFAPLVAYSQCTAPEGYQCVPNDTVSRMSKALTELAAQRDLVQKFTNERAANDALNAASLQVIKAANDVIAFKDNVIASQERLAVAYEKIIQLQAVLIDKLTAKMSQPTSAWSKFVQTVEKIALITLGITVGRGL